MTSSVPSRDLAAGVERSAGDSIAMSRIRLPEYVWVAVQLALVLGAAFLYRLELERGFGVVAAIVFLGFLVHSWLPLQWRASFFVFLCIIALFALLRWDAIWVIGLGSALLGICHLPVSWGWRVAWLVAAGLILAALRVGMLEAQWSKTALPVLGAMFMFRLILYVYDLKSEKTPASIPQRLAYFFMLPNACFPLFPVVDYKSFLKSYYDSPAVEIYQKGLHWMLRGVIHLLLYRLVYLYFLPKSDEELSGVIGVYLFMAMTYGLYLRVSGLFHLIVGMLCMFGFNLARTNNLYFLASSFTDLWRRINIYWKDFMMTIVFYPIFMRLRNRSVVFRMLSATLTVFVVTWFLHSYQWLWLLGVFPVRGTDIVFWGVLGIALAANSVWELRRGRKRALTQRSWSLRESLRASVFTVGVFSGMAVLWTVWDAGSLEDWAYRLLMVRQTTPTGWLQFASLIGALIVLGVLTHTLTSRGLGPERLKSLEWQHSRQVVPVVAALLLCFVSPVVYERLPRPMESAVALARTDRLNSIDAARQERGYYETLSRASWQEVLGNGQAPQEDEAVPLFHLGAAVETDDLRGYELVPNKEVLAIGSRFTTNRWGMRDREYDLAKPAGTFRIALIGSSHVMGAGVADEETFDNVLEHLLNAQSQNARPHRYEILNFAVGGYGLLQTLYVIEKLVPRFRPDMVIYVAHPTEGRRAVRRLQRIPNSGIDLGGDYEYVKQILRQAEATGRLPESEFFRRVGPYQSDIVEWAFQRKIDAIRSMGATPVFVYLPLTDTPFDREELRSLVRISASNGAINVVLDDVYAGQDLDSIRIAEWDNHPNARGHRLVAERLEREFRGSPEVFEEGDGASPPISSRP